nr:hypothetical protein [uncultured Desulfobacter sp.]
MVEEFLTKDGTDYGEM